METQQIIEYQLFLMTSSSETQAFVSRDAEEVAELRNTIEHAMAGALIAYPLARMIAMPTAVELFRVS